MSEDDFNDVKSNFAEGKVVKMRITEVDYENQKLVGSIKQASPEYLAKLNVDAVEVGEKVTGKVAAVHKEVVVLTLVPSGVRALLSLSVLASMRGTSSEELLESLEEDQEIEDLVVSVKNPAKGIVIVADKVRADKGAHGATSGQVKQCKRHPGSCHPEERQVSRLHRRPRHCHPCYAAHYRRSRRLFHQRHPPQPRPDALMLRCLAQVQRQERRHLHAPFPRLPLRLHHGG